MTPRTAPPRLAPKLPDIPPGYDPAKPWKLDYLERRPCAAVLTDLLKGVTEPYVIAVNAGWGQGKSMFLRMWRDDLVNTSGCHCILFDAWKSDHGGDPLVALMGAVSDYVAEGQADSEKVKKAKRNLWKFGQALVRIMPKYFLEAGLNIFARKMFSLTDLLEDTDQAVAVAQEKAEGDDKDVEITAKMIAEGGTELYSEYRLQQEALKGFKEQLSLIGKEMGTQDFPLVIMVDELDRCRPDYALLTLERIKHLFDIPGVVFVLALEEKSLARTVSRLYGLRQDKGEYEEGISESEAYLRRFIDLEYRLPSPGRNSFAKFLLTSFDLSDQFGELWCGISPPDFFAKQAGMFGLTLRDMAQVVSQAATVSRAYKTNASETIFALIFLALRKAGHPVYTRLMTGGNLDFHTLVDDDAPIIPPWRDLKQNEKAILEAGCHRLQDTEKEFSTWLRQVGDPNYPPRMKNPKYDDTLEAVLRHINEDLPTRSRLCLILEFISRISPADCFVEFFPGKGWVLYDYETGSELFSHEDKAKFDRQAAVLAQEQGRRLFVEGDIAVKKVDILQKFLLDMSAVIGD